MAGTVFRFQCKEVCVRAGLVPLIVQDNYELQQDSSPSKFSINNSTSGGGDGGGGKRSWFHS